MRKAKADKKQGFVEIFCWTRNDVLSADDCFANFSKAQRLCFNTIFSPIACTHITVCKILSEVKNATA